MERSTERKTQAGFAFALACVVLISVVSFLSLRRLTEDARWATHTEAVIDELQALAAAVTDAESAERAYLITGNEAALGSYRIATRRVTRAFGRLKDLTADNALEQRRLAALEPLIERRMGERNRLIDLRRTRGFANARREEILVEANRHTEAAIGRLIGQMRASERGLLAARDRRTRSVTAWTRITLAAGGGIAFAAAALALFAVRRDLAGRRRAEQALRALNSELETRVSERAAELERVNASLAVSERRFRAFVNATSEVVYQMSPDWTEMRHLAGRDFIADQTDPSQTWLDKYIPPEEQPRVLAAIEEAIRTQSMFQLEHRVRRADGTLGWISSRAVPLKDGKGGILEWFGAASDVTERKQGRLKLESQLARLSLLGNITRAMGERQDVDSIFQVVIRTLEEHLKLEFCSICLYEPDGPRLTVARVGVRSFSLANELAMSEHARIDIDQNGLSRCVSGQLVYEPDLGAIRFPFPERLSRGGLGSLVAAPLRFESRVFGVLLAARRQAASFSSSECEFLRQLSEHVALAAHQAHLYQALQRAYDDLRQTQQAVLQQERLLALGTMASGIAHDINNAISPIMLYTDLLLEEPGIDARARKSLEVIQRATEQVGQTVARMREFYRAREPQQQLLPVDLNRLVEQVIDLTHARWSDIPQRRGLQIELETRLAPGLPAVFGIETELRDAVVNLVFNAVDAMPRGGRLSLETRLHEPEQSDSPACRLIQLTVADTGVGMDEQTRSRCLEPFFTTKGERGTGLGLAMVYGAMERHGGEIEVTSVVGCGTRVTLSFPMAAISGGVATGVQPIQVVSAKRILLVDDDPIVLKSLREALAIDGHDVTAADGGQAGIEAFRAAQAAGEPFDVVITDLGMPQIDGRQVAVAVRAAAPETLVLLLTGWGRRLVDEGDVPPHVDRVLTKPPKLRELREALALRPGRPG